MDLQDNIILTGFVSNEELIKYYATAGIFITASLYEGLGCMYLESLSSGTPVIAYENEAITEIFGGEKIGCITKRDPGDMADKIVKLLKNEELINVMSKKGRNRILFFFPLLSFLFHRIVPIMELILRVCYGHPLG